MSLLHLCPLFTTAPVEQAARTGRTAPRQWTVKGRIKHENLPTRGKVRFVPPKNWDPSNPKRGTSHGFIDKWGNEWVDGPSRTRGEAWEWDVQLSKKGKAHFGWASADGNHLNVSFQGIVTH